VNRFPAKVSFIWGIADLLRGDYKQSEYGQVILPLTLLRRLDILRHPGGIAFGKLRVPGEVTRYVARFPAQIREIFECFRFSEQLARLHKTGLLELLLQRFGEIDLRPESVSNQEMGYIFEELIRKFSEQSGETAGEHFTPREVVRLMVQLVFEDGDATGKTLYDPACGTGGMLSAAEEYAAERNPAARLEIYGQELNPESYAICKADALLRGHDAGQIALGNSFLDDAFAGRRFDYMLSNPPFGVEWKKAEKQIRLEHERLGFKGRFGAGLPRVNDGSLLFLEHMLSKMKPEGTRIAVVFNGSPLFTGEAGSGESEIRRWIIEQDWLEAILGLPDQLFYNTGLSTYIWLLTNQKSRARAGQVQLINAASFSRKMRRSLGAKRNEIAPEQIEEIVAIQRQFRESRYSKIFRNEEFGYRRITVERPLRLSFQVSPERIAAAGAKFQPALTHINPQAIYRDQTEFEKALAAAFQKAGLKLGRTLARKLSDAFGRQDDDAGIYRDSNGRPVPDPDLRDYENVPLREDAAAWFKNAVIPHAPNAWIDETRTRIGYSIPFTRHFFEPAPQRPLEEIEQEILSLEDEVRGMIRNFNTA
jgi:type I restriction enzyme M protein